MNPKFSLAVVLAVATATPTSYGHVYDEYLQSALVVIEPGDIRLRMNLTPGTEIADKFFGQLDRNRDGVVSSEEATAYAETLKQDLTVRLDGREAKLQVSSSKVPDLSELRGGHGIIAVEFAVTPTSFGSGQHTLTLENKHFASLGIYLFNAARPKSASIRIVKQHRNVKQSEGQIEFAYDAPSQEQ